MTNNTSRPSTVDGPVTGAQLFSALRTIQVEALTLVGELALARRAYADLVAACRAGLLAHRDGESDAWCYLADELPPAPAGHPLRTDAHGMAAGGGADG